MHERLVENWLDSASERSYQAPFCQMLAARGHRIVHSTRHSPLEFGKDIITIDPDGTPCAYQLKGNPSGRLTKSQFGKILTQLIELTSTAISHPGVPKKQHRTFLVTNGQIEEEVVTAVQNLNAANEQAGYPTRKLELIARGDLLQMTSELGSSLWPTEILQMHSLLEMLVEDGTAMFPAARFNSMLSELLGLDEDAPKTWSAAEIKRRISSGALLTGLSLHRFQLKDNHLAIVSAWIQYAAAAIAACDRFDVSYTKNAQAVVQITRAALKDSLVDLAKEALVTVPPLTGNVLVDPLFLRARQTLLAGWLSLLWFWCNKDGWPADLPKEDLESLLLKLESKIWIWGEAAIPQVVLYYWFLKRQGTSQAQDQLLIRSISAVSARDNRGMPEALASPYWSFEEVARHMLAPFLGTDQDPLARETARGMSFYVASLFHLLVRTNRKADCRSLWPNVSRMRFAEFRPAHPWNSCLAAQQPGELSEVAPPLTKSWNDAVNEARVIGCPEIPSALVNDKELFAAFVLVFPYRGSPAAIRNLGHYFNRTWLIPPPIVV